MSFEVPEHVRPIRQRVRRFIEERVYPLEDVLHEGGDAGRDALARLMSEYRRGRRVDFGRGDA